MDKQRHEATLVGVSGGAFELGDAALSQDGTMLLVPDGNPSSPGLRRYRVEGGDVLTTMGTLDTSPTALLPPRQVTWFR